MDTCDWLATYVQVESTLVLLGRWFNVSNEQNVLPKINSFVGCPRSVMVAEANVIARALA